MPAFDGRLKLPRPLSSEAAAGPQAFLELIQRLSRWEAGGTAAERDAFYGVPTTNAERDALQGASWSRKDRGWVEHYFYEKSGSNPAGAVGAGAGAWLPVGGAMPYISLKGMESTTVPTGSGITWKTGLNAAGTTRSRGDYVRSLREIRLPFVGYWSAEANVSIGGNPGGTYRDLQLILGENFQTLLREPNGTFPPIGESLTRTLNAEGPVVDVATPFQVGLGQNSGVSLTFLLNHASLRYHGPV